MTLRHLLQLTIWLSCAFAPAGAQLKPARAADPLSEHSCAACHTPHSATRSAWGLKLGAAAASAAYAATGLQAASLTCLRCHATADIRMREAASGDPGLPIIAGSYLGLDLSDDHPLGIAKRNRVSRLTLLRPLLEAERQAKDRSPAALAIDCSDCHDPHDRSGAGWLPANDRRCAACHDEGRYALATHAALSCANCHRLHGGAPPGLADARDAELLCTRCHQTPGRAGADPDQMIVPGPPGHVVNTAERCVSCHSPHGPG